MTGFISFLWQATVIILLISIGFTLLRHVLNQLLYVDVEVPYSQELNNNSDYLTDMLKQRTAQLYSLVDIKTGNILIFDTVYSVFKFLDGNVVDSQKHLVLFTEQELYDFGYDKSSAGCKWLPIKYEIREGDANENN